MNISGVKIEFKIISVKKTKEKKGYDWTPLKKTESKKIKNEAQRELAQNAINRIYNLTGDVVAAAQTTLVEQVKQLQKMVN